MNSTKPRLWGNKRYHNLNFHLRDKFGEKIFKIPLDAGFTCPNRDGKLALGGCLFCGSKGSGDFTAGSYFSLQEQFIKGKNMMHKKWSSGKYIAYFQAFTNTYAPIDKLREIYTSLLNEPDLVGIAIATRPDCLEKEVLDLLQEINEKLYLWVEVGLQTRHERTSKLLNMHYDYKCFLDSIHQLKARNIESCAHMILGLPGETRGDMIATGELLAKTPVKGVKIHLLHLMKNTALEKLYTDNTLQILSMDEYVNLVVDILEILPDNKVMHRLTGDSPRDILIKPKWSLKKWEVLNAIDQCLIERQTWQGRLAH